jgi:hypothetical protein
MIDPRGGKSNVSKQRPERPANPNRVWLDISTGLGARLHAVSKRLRVTRDEAIRNAVEEWCDRHEAVDRFCRQPEIEGAALGVEPFTSPRQVNQSRDPLDDIGGAGHRLALIEDAAKRFFCG